MAIGDVVTRIFVSRVQSQCNEGLRGLAAAKVWPAAAWDVDTVVRKLGGSHGRLQGNTGTR